METCLECGFVSEHKVTFRRHIEKEHSLTRALYHVKHVLNGVHPVCECGCGELTSWRDSRGFARLIYGHTTQELRDSVSVRRAGSITAHSTKLKLSIALSSFYETEDGRQKASARAQKLHDFHISVKGEEWSKQQSTRLKLFNSSEYGKLVKIEAGRKVSKWRNSNPDAVKNMGSKLSTFWNSIAGKEKLSIRSQKMKDFYSSEDGKKVIEKMAQKLKLKNRLSKQSFEDRAVLVSDCFLIDDCHLNYESYEGISSLKKMSVDVTCRKKGHVMTRQLDRILYHPICLICNGIYSKPQNDIVEYIRSLDIDVISNDRSVIYPLEIDVYIPSRNFGIEFNGLYWHSETNRDCKYHVENKHIAARQKSLNLMTIFEDEWKNKQEIIKSMIKSRLGLAQRIHARSLQLVELSSDKKKEFFENSHLEGDVSSRTAFALVDPITKKVMASLSLRRPFHGSLHKSAEIARFAHSPGVLVVGGLSRLVKKAKEWAKNEGMTSLLSYVDGRIGEGKGYMTIGFKQTRTSQCRFWWTDYRSRFDRFKFKACNGQTQSDVALEAGVVRIWGARNFVFELSLLDQKTSANKD